MLNIITKLYQPGADTRGSVQPPGQDQPGGAAEQADHQQDGAGLPGGGGGEEQGDC